MRFARVETDLQTDKGQKTHPHPYILTGLLLDFVWLGNCVALHLCSVHKVCCNSSLGPL